MFSASSFSNRGPRLSGPRDLFGLRSFSSFVIPLSVMLILSHTGNWLSIVGILSFRKKSSLDTSSLLEKTD